jgi:hypothetical protein
MAALVEAVPQVVLGGAGLVMFGVVTATGVRILSAVDFKTNASDLCLDPALRHRRGAAELLLQRRGQRRSARRPRP